MQLSVPWRNGQKKPFTSIPRIDRTHPLTRGMVFYAYDLGGVIIDLFNGGFGSIFSSTTHLIRRPSKFGTAFKYGGTATSDSVTLPVSNAKVSSFDVAAPYSMACGALPTGTPATGAYMVSISTAAQDDCGFGSAATATTVKCLLSNGANQPSFSGTFTANVYHTLMVVATGASAGTLYFDGKFDSTTAGGITLAHTGAQVCFNTGTPKAAALGGGINGFIYYFAGWNRVLTAPEAFLLHNDPYCFLIYPEDEMFASLTDKISVGPVVSVPSTASLLTMMGVG